MNVATESLTTQAPPTREGDLAWLAAVILGGLYLLSPLLGAGLVVDDYHIMDFVVREIDMDEGLTLGNLGGITHYFLSTPTSSFQLYRPLVVLTFGLNYLTTGVDEYWFQLTSMALHLGCALTLFRLARTLFPSLPSAWLALPVGWFIISPVQLEVVSWSAARSETLSFLFGAWALILKVRKPSRVLVPAGLCAVALTAKESALVFLAAVAAVDLLGITREDGGLRAPRSERARRAAIRGLPLLVVFAAYAALRLHLFGALFGSYGHRRNDDYLEISSLTGNVLRTVAVLMAPVSSIVYAGLAARIALIVAYGVAWTGLGGQHSRSTANSRHGAIVALAGVLLVAPLVLSVIVNPASTKLVGTRALYTPLAGLTLLVILGIARARRPVRRWLPIGILLGLALLTCRPSQAPHIETHRDMQATIASLRDPIRACGDTSFDAIAVIGYHEAGFFGGSYTMATPVRAALRRPFLDKNYELYKIECEPSELREDFRTFVDVMSGDTDRLAIFSLADLPEDRPRPTYVLATTGRLAAPGGGSLRPVFPAKNATLVVDLTKPDSPPVAFRFETRHIEATSFVFTLFACDDWLPELHLPAAGLPSTETESGRIYDIVIPRRELERFRPVRGKPMVWLVTARDAAGQDIARTAPHLFFVDLER